MENINFIVSQNIIKYRKRINLTQAELAEKINYSDKAVSKWERGECLPDVETLVKLSDIFGVTLNDLCYENRIMPKFSIPLSEKAKRFFITFLSIGLVWLIATIVFTMLLVFAQGLPKKWLCFVYALPISSIVGIVFTSIWKKCVYNFIFITILIWSFITCIVFTTTFIAAKWLFLIGVPMQLLTIAWFLFKSRIFEKISRIKSKKKINDNLED